MLVGAGVTALGAPVILGVVNAPQLCAQSQAEHLAFEVASIRSNNSTDLRGTQLQFLPGGKFVARNVPLVVIVATAYNLPFQSTRLTGGKDWNDLALGKYDIEAKADDAAFPPGLSSKVHDDNMRLMLQSLLEERFKLKMRREPKEQPVYALVAAKNGPNLQKSKMQAKDCDGEPTGLAEGCHSVSGGQGRGIQGDAISIADVALFVQNWTDRPVVDKTGLTDLYTIRTEGWLPMRQRPPSPEGAPKGREAELNDPDRPTLAKVFEQLGLKMESQRAVVDMFVIEHVERPAAN